MLCETSQAQEVTYCMIPIIGNIKSRQIHREGKAYRWLPEAEVWGIWNKHLVGPVWGYDENVLELDRGGGCTRLY